MSKQIPLSTIATSDSIRDPELSSISSKRYKVPQTGKRPPSRLSLLAQDKWARRVLAPYVPVVRKVNKASLRRDVNYYNFFLTKKSSMLMRSMRNYITNKKDLPGLLYETAGVLKVLTDSLGMRLYFVDQTKDQLYQYQKNVTYPRCRVNYDLNTCKTVSCYVARTKEFVMVDDVNEDSRFPEGVSYKDNVKPVLCLPIVTQLSTFAVIELYRDVSSAPYKKNDLKLAVVLCGWIGLTIQENQEGFLLHQKQAVNSTLLQMVLTYYSQPDTLESLLSEILNYAKKEIEAEKGTFYVITNQEHMIADVYEEGISDYNKFLVKKKQAVRFGRDSTVACLVFKEKHSINVKDLFNDPRFKPQVQMDEELLIIERTELCIPIVTNNKLLGIISMVNKANESYFTAEDEQIMEVIGTYAGLALFYAQGRRDITKTQTNLECAYDLLQYHLKPCRMELDKLKNDIDYTIPKNLLDFSYYILPDDLAAMPQLYVKMMRDIIPDEEINFDDLYSFILTAKRSYRNNPYHNFEHAFNVSHCMYTILIRNLEKFSLLEREALMIAALTHDIDHGGVTNNFLLITNHRLSLIYEESIWENHHCFVTEQLLRNYKIFKNITEETETTFMKEVHENIIFTDLVYYFKNRNKLIPILNSGEFNFYNATHKYLLRNVCMTMADLSGQGKPFSITKKLTDALYREFYAQGDREKAMGFTPLAMMDRDSESHIPDDQSQFLSIVVMSAADLIRSLLPNTEEIYLNAEMLRDTWRRILESRGEKLWRQCDSLAS